MSARRQQPSRAQVGQADHSPHPGWLLLFDVGNTHTHVGLANRSRVVKQADLPTSAWRTGEAIGFVRRFVRRVTPGGAAVCSVVPAVTPLLRDAVAKQWNLSTFELNARTLRGVGLDYPRPNTIGPDRLANAVAARRYYGAPSVVVDFGTAVTFDVIDSNGNYVGGVIAPGLAAMTEYLHEKTALLPRIKIREPKQAVGKSTEEAMLVGAVHGYRGLVREVLKELRAELNAKRLPVIATGGYAELIASQLPEITAVERDLTLEGLRLHFEPG